MNIAVIGTGYVGLVTGACLASFGSEVVCCDNDSEKIGNLKQGILPVYEPGLSELVADIAGHDKARDLMDEVPHTSGLTFTSEIEDAVKSAEIVFISVNTPVLPDNRCDISNVLEAARGIARGMKQYAVVAVKSTVPVGTARFVRDEIRKGLECKIRHSACAGLELGNISGEEEAIPEFDVVSNPEFLREGSAIRDFMYPDRIVIGADSEKAVEIMIEAYRGIISADVPVLVTNPESAELVKYASNTFLAAKISFINEIADLCERCGADVIKVAEGMGLDRRIGSEFLKAGPGFGGSCFPKDIRSLVGMADDFGVKARIAGSVLEVNNVRKESMAQKIAEVAQTAPGGGVITVLGLAFKPDTDDIRESPSIAIIGELLKKGITIRVYDPQAMENTKKMYPALDVIYCPDINSACHQSDCIVLVTEWKQFMDLDFVKLAGIVRTPLIIDLRNIYLPERVRSFGFAYEGIGRK